MTLKERTITISSLAAEAMKQLAAQYVPNETGGILAGWAADEGVIIAHAVGPGPRAKHGPHSFIRDGKYSQDQLDTIYEQSSGQCDYVGEWHSHPVSSPPSPTDRRSMRDISQDPKYQKGEPLLVLCVRNGRDSWLLRAFQHVGEDLQELRIVVSAA